MTLPALGESVTEGTVTRWLKQVGDQVAVDEPLLEVSTDKVDTEIPSPVAGTLLEIKVAEDETVDVGAELALIGSGDAGSAAAAPSAPEPQASEPAEEPGPGTGPGAGARAAAAEAAGPGAGRGSGRGRADGGAGRARAGPGRRTARRPPRRPTSGDAGGEGDGRAYVTPLVRKLATQHGVDLAGAHRHRGRRTHPQAGRAGRRRGGQGRGGRRTGPGAQRPGRAAGGAGRHGTAAPAAEPSPLRGTTEKMSRLRKVIASRMVESLQTSAQLTTVVEVDVTSISRLRDSVKAEFATREGVKLSYLPFFAKAAIDALKQHPSLNAAIDTEKGEVTYFDRENLSVAVDTEKGLLTPVIKDAGDLSIAGLARKIADVAERTRSEQDPARRALRWHVHADQHRQPRRALRHPDHQPAPGGDPRDRRRGQASGGHRRPEPRGDDRGPPDGLPGPHLRPPAGRRCRRGRFLSDVKSRLESGQFDV